eukprot:scaffold3208_cov402-Prasinococcus_capsulatus_cf.AAC.11
MVPRRRTVRHRREKRRPGALDLRDMGVHRGVAKRGLTGLPRVGLAGAPGAGPGRLCDTARCEEAVGIDAHHTPPTYMYSVYMGHPGSYPPVAVGDPSTVAG